MGCRRSRSSSCLNTPRLPGAELWDTRQRRGGDARFAGFPLGAEPFYFTRPLYCRVC
jgi:hypothetical protein